MTDFEERAEREAERRLYGLPISQVGEVSAFIAGARWARADALRASEVKLRHALQNLLRIMDPNKSPIPPWQKDELIASAKALL